MIPYILTALGGYLVGSSVKQYADGGQVRLLAPNGKPSNLTPEQYRLVRTPEFKAWFGDWENDAKNASKVVDENGEPLVVYHGTYNEFNIFKNENSAYYFSENEEYAKIMAKVNRYGRKGKEIILPVFLNIRKIKKLDFIEHIFVKEFMKKTNNSADGLFGYDLGSNIISYVVFKSNQIKLADGTNTAFDSSNPDIRYEEGGSVVWGKEVELSKGNKLVLNKDRSVKAGKNFDFDYDVQDKDGKNIGMFHIADEGGYYQVSNVELKNQRTGLGTEIYKTIIQKLDKPLYSDSSLTDASKGVWEKLVSQGIAEKYTETVNVNTIRTKKSFNRERYRTVE
jgi:hypothetical protein